MEELNAQLVDCGVATLALGGESESGDQHLIQPFAEGVLVAAVDGLGHGAEAAEAARIAVQTLREHAGESVIALARRCHRNLQRSRGAVMSLACFNAADSVMTWMGIGNVGGLSSWPLMEWGMVSMTKPTSAIRRSGLPIGYSIPTTKAAMTRW